MSSQRSNWRERLFVNPSRMELELAAKLESSGIQYQTQFINESNCMNAETLSEKQDEGVACLGYFDMNVVADIRPNPGSLHVHSSSEPYNEEMIVDTKR